jgi:hypothetical protein
MIRSLLGRPAKGGSGWPEAADNLPAIGLCLLFPAIFYYAFLITAVGSTGLFSPVPYGLTFNSMLSHLLDGRFDVDPIAVGYEGYFRDGAVYSYFGILPALLRAPFLFLRDFAAIDFTRLSCLVAVSLMALFKILTALVVWRSVALPRRFVLLSLFVAAILVSGPQIQFLRPSIYQETLLWADVFAAAFVLLVLHGWTRREGFTTGLMSVLAALAGLCLLTRVSTALGLYLALGFIFLWRGWQEIGRSGDGSLWRRLPVFSLPMLVLFGFAAAAAIVNQERWGNPLVFVDMHRALMPAPNPHHVMPLHDYGQFNFIRLPFGLLYYFLPIWVLHDGSGQLLWSDFVERTMSDVELPPSSFLVSDPLIVGLAVYGSMRLARATGVPSRIPIALTALGLVIPIVLMLIAISMTFRYRMEFYPLFELCAFVGFRCLLAAPRRGIQIVIGGAMLASILAAQLLWLLYMLSPYGMASQRMEQNGIIGFYESLMH